MTLGTHKDSAYIDLLKSFPPRPIRTEEELLATQKVIDSLIDKAEELTIDEQEYLNVLGTLVYEYQLLYEEPIKPLQGIELLRALMVEYSLKETDLVSILKTQFDVSALLNGERQITSQESLRLAKFFSMSSSDFIEPTSL